MRSIEARLPSYRTASKLVEAYLTHVAWFSRIVTREQIVDELLPMIYKRGTPSAGSVDECGAPVSGSGSGRAQSGDCNDVVYVHRLALFFAVMALGAAVETSLPINSNEAARYNGLARTCWGLRPVFQGTSLESVQTVMLFAHYHFSTCQTLVFEPGWKILIFAMTLGLSVS